MRDHRKKNTKNVPKNVDAKNHQNLKKNINRRNFDSHAGGWSLLRLYSVKKVFDYVKFLIMYDFYKLYFSTLSVFGQKYLFLIMFKFASNLNF